MFGLLLVALVLAVGVGIDVGRQVSAKNKLQDAIDATGFALAHLPVGTPAAQLQTTADAWVKANLGPVQSQFSGLSVVATPTTGQITITATGQVSTTLMALAGFKQMGVRAESTVSWAPTRMEVALVLDNTGSMKNNNKIQTLIDASQQLVTTLFQQANGDPNAVKISVVPFSMTVNVGAQYQSAPWMSGVLPPAYATALEAAYPGITWPYGKDLFAATGINRFNVFSQLGQSWGGCVESRPAPYDVQETPPNVANPATLFVPFFAPDEPNDTFGGGYPAYPNDYLTDKAGGTWDSRQTDQTKYDNNPKWTPGQAMPYPWGGVGYQMGPNAGCELVALQRLTNNEAAIHNEISQMRAIGDTNLAMGMMWGWHTLSPLGPFADGVPYNTANAKKVIVFLTDGWNQSSTTPAGWPNGDNSYYSGLGYAWQNRLGLPVTSTNAQREAALDARTALVCQNIKAASSVNPVTIYTIRIDVASTQSPAILQQCASGPGKFFDVPNPADLSAAFATIAGSIGQLRLAN